MKKTLTRISCLLVVSIAPLASAIPINGDIHIAAMGSTAQVNMTLNTVTFSPAAPTNNAQVSFRSGTWSPVLGAAVSYANFTYQPLSVTAVGGWAPNTVWRIDADTYFVLNAITSVMESTGVVLQGTGTAFDNAFDPTPGAWSFSANESGATFSFSSTAVVASVPEGGTTIALLGLALAAVALARRKQLA